MSTTAAILSVLHKLDTHEFDATTPEVEEIPESESAPIRDTPAQAEKRATFNEQHRAALAAAGCDLAKLDEFVAVKAISGGKQRITPTWATVCAPEAMAFWAGRTDEQIEADMIKLLRRDGGQLGQEAVYRGMIARSATPAEAAAEINALVGQRFYSARVYAQMAVNELRRRRAVRAGRDPKTIKYLMVRPPTESNSITVNAELAEVDESSPVNAEPDVHAIVDSTSGEEVDHHG